MSCFNFSKLFNTIFDCIICNQFYNEDVENSAGEINEINEPNNNQNNISTLNDQLFQGKGILKSRFITPNYEVCLYVQSNYNMIVFYIFF